MKTPIKIALVIFSLLMFSCVNKQTEKKQAANDFDSLMENQEIGFGMVQEVIYRFPTPGEMFGVIKDGGLTFNIDLLNNNNNAKNYLGLKAKALNLGIFTADFAYIALFGRQNEAVNYIETIEELSKSINVFEAIDENMVTKIKDNLGNIDSLVTFSDEAFIDMFSYCENNDLHPTNALISAGAYIEGLYIALNSINSFEENHPVLNELAEQKFSFENLMLYASSYKYDSNVKEVVEDLKQISEIFSSLDSEKRESKISSKSNSAQLIIGGGKRYFFNEKQFIELKTITNRIRKNIINLS